MENQAVVEDAVGKALVAYDRACYGRSAASCLRAGQLRNGLRTYDAAHEGGSPGQTRDPDYFDEDLAIVRFDAACSLNNSQGCEEAGWLREEMDLRRGRGAQDEQPQAAQDTARVVQPGRAEGKPSPTLGVATNSVQPTVQSAAVAERNPAQRINSHPPLLSVDDTWYMERSRIACPGMPDDAWGRIGGPPGYDEFERNSQERQRATLRQRLEATTHRLTNLRVSVGEYDFGRQRFPVHLTSESFTFSGRLPGTRCRDDSGQSMGSCEWRYYHVPGDNPASRTVYVNVPESQARGWAEGVTAHAAVRVDGVVRHINCERMCMRIFGQTDCDVENTGAGAMFKGDVVDLMIVRQNEVVYEESE